MQNPNEIVRILQQGNARFASDKPMHPRTDPVIRRQTLVEGQKPMVAVLSCSDSRSPVEIVFDQGIGDIFSFRDAGNIVTRNVVGTLELGVYKFGIPVIVVLGHTDCSAVTLAINEDTLQGSISPVIEKIIPIARETRRKYPELTGGDFLTEVTKANALKGVREIREMSPLIREKSEQGKMLVVAALHDLETGKVRWLE